MSSDDHSRQLTGSDAPRVAPERIISSPVTLIQWIAIAGSWIAIAFLWYQMGRTNEAEQFRIIADQKEQELQQFLAGKGSQLLEYHSTMTELKETRTRSVARFRGQIICRYLATGEVDPVRSQQEAVIHYLYLNKEGCWKPDHVDLKLTEPSDVPLIVTEGDIEAVFNVPKSTNK